MRWSLPHLRWNSGRRCRAGFRWQAGPRPARPRLGARSASCEHDQALCSSIGVIWVVVDASEGSGTEDTTVERAAEVSGLGEKAAQKMADVDGNPRACLGAVQCASNQSPRSSTPRHCSRWLGRRGRRPRYFKLFPPATQRPAMLSCRGQDISGQHGVLQGCEDPKCTFQILQRAPSASQNCCVWCSFLIKEHVRYGVRFA